MAADRAYLAGGRVGPARAALAALTARMMARFEAAGAQRVDPAALHQADVLLDVYGEDLRGRAFIVEQPGAGPLFLRPDFTLPVLQLHRAARAEPARYCYLGPVWRRQPGAQNGRPTEFLQAGVEVYGEDAAEADAEVFALMRDALAEGGVTAPEVVTGDLGVAIAVLEAVAMAPARRAALRRHFWRPVRFQALLRRYAGPAPAPSPLRRALLEAASAGGVPALAEGAGGVVGARDLADVAARAQALAEDAAAAPVAAEDARLIDAALAVEGPADAAHARLAELAKAGGVDIAPALERFARRLDALARRGVEAGALPFRAATARTLEYYDGFVFEMAAPGRPDLPPLAAGGRYDGIAAALGGPPAPAVGAMVRPEALLAAGGLADASAPEAAAC
ncbi:ATP phosphoribosyltransferase regulatory subunit [Rubrimonas cliftonensis]|uniref:ATP phosphoribosyltransferase regulatory subunit n=1 Tax=Rubrimonas cliftonensis TaxID=89524 RepID=A0A1H3X4W3_9RHOB|nr:ATP phosphoribosyltransferase regulatory subunit [Rubrimonas cliftonensis]SDZ94280.1 ATP phosphoribosyltransferase regulatory subunit [Rubrimonas cliftonensis]